MLRGSPAVKLLVRAASRGKESIAMPHSVDPSQRPQGVPVRARCLALGHLRLVQVLEAIDEGEDVSAHFDLGEQNAYRPVGVDEEIGALAA